MTSKRSVFIGILLLGFFLSSGTNRLLADTYTQPADTVASPETASQTGSGIGVFSGSAGGFQASPGNSTGVGSLVAPISNTLHADDLNISQGAVHFTETDLELPGRNGLNLVIARQYNSQKFTTETYPNNGGFGIGRGWSFSMGMRAYVAFRKGDKTQFIGIYIETPKGVERYAWDNDKKVFISDQPANFNKVSFSYQGQENTITTGMDRNAYTNGKIQIISDTGSIYTFAMPVYSEQPGAQDQFSNYRTMFIYGYELSEVRDLFGNKVSYVYDYLTHPDYNREILNGLRPETQYVEFSLFNSKVLGDAYSRWFNDLAYVNRYDNHVVLKWARLSKIIDSYGREVRFSYMQEGRAPLEAGKEMAVTGISYQNTLGNWTEIQYTYDPHACLTSVRQAGLPESTYRYRTYSNSKDSGYLLMQKQNSLGSMTQYDYQTLESREKIWSGDNRTFEDTDLFFPGKDGFDLAIKRVYQSEYASTNGAPFSGGWNPFMMNKGWRLNQGGRAYVTLRRNDKFEYWWITDERPEGTTRYGWDGNRNGFFSGSNSARFIYKGQVNPDIRTIEWQDFTRNTSIEIQKEGKTYRYSLFCFEDLNRRIKHRFVDEVKDLVHLGFELESITDARGNMIRYTYSLVHKDPDPVDGGANPVKDSDSRYWLAKIVGSDDYERWNQETPGSQDEAYSKVQRYWYRIEKIYDSYNREIQFNYTSFPRNQRNDDRQFVVTSISAPEFPFNTPKEQIIYHYDYEGYLWKVVKPGSVLSNFSDAFQLQFGYLSFTQAGVDKVKALSVAEKMNRETGKVQSILFSYTLAREGDVESAEPIVIEKRVYKSPISSPFTFRVIYSMENGQPKKTPFLATRRPDFPVQWGQAFSEVTIDAPSQTEDIVYTLKNGFPVVVKQGNQETQHAWNLETNQKLSQKNLIERDVQTEVTFQYDAFFNQTVIETKKGSVLYLRQTATYSAASAQNRLYHLPLVQLTTEISTGHSQGSQATYTPEGKVFEAFQLGDSVSKKVSTTYYDSQGRPTTLITYGPGGTLSLVRRYEEGTVLKDIQLLNGKTISTEYERFTGRPIKTTDENGHSTLIEYDAFGRVIKTTYPNNTSETIAYSSDLKTTTTTKSGVSSITEIDGFGRTILTDPPGEDNERKIYYYYAEYPSEIYKKEQGGWVLKKEFKYDSKLRQIESKNMDFGTTTYRYDDLNRTITTTDARGHSVTKKMDELGRQIQISEGADAELTQFSYNAFGEKWLTTDARQNKHRIDSDGFGRISTFYYPYSTTSAKKQSTLTYTSAGGAFLDTSTVWNEEGTVFSETQFLYDSENRLFQRLYNGQVKETLRYDQTDVSNGKGKLTTAETPDAITRYQYDNMGRAVREITTVKALNKTLDVQYAYSEEGLLTQVTLPDHHTFSYDYDALNRQTTARYDATPMVRYVYNSNGTVKSMTFGNGVTLEYTYERGTLITALTAKTSDGTSLYSQTNTFDATGLLAGLVHQDYMDQKTPLSRVYAYTPKSQLQSVSIQGENRYTYRYDQTGNLLRYETPSVTGLKSDNMVIDPNKDQLTQKQFSEGRKIQFKYSPEGNLSEKTYINADSTIDQKTTYTFNYQNQLESLSKNDSLVATYHYDHKKQRVLSQVNSESGKVQKWASWSSAGQLLAEGIGEVTTVRYLYSGNQKIAMIRPKDVKNPQLGDDIFYFINNLQGTPVLIVDQAGAPVYKFNLTEWGALGTVKADPAEINYTGKKLDLESGFYYFNQRYYDPEIGRFISPDPAGQGLNPYAFSGNNPILFVDPNGEFFIGFLIAAMIEGAKAAAFNLLVQGGMSLANGYGLTMINWDVVGQSFISGGIAGGLASGGGIIKPGGGDIFSHALAGGINNGITNAAVKWGLGKGGDMMANFQYGFGYGAAQGSVVWGFKELSNSTLTTNPGKGAAGKDGVPSKGEQPVPSGLTVPSVEERQKYQALADGMNNLGDDRAPGKAVTWFSEGELFSETANQIPGGNATSYIHDYLTYDMNNFAVSTMWYPHTAIIAYYALYPSMQYYYNQGNY